MSVYESSSSDELNAAEYEAWYDEMMRDAREPNEDFCRGAMLDIGDVPY